MMRLSIAFSVRRMWSQIEKIDFHIKQINQINDLNNLRKDDMNSLINKYQIYNDRELVDMIHNNNMEASYFLIQVKYKNDLYNTIGAYLKNYTDYDLRYHLNEFYYQIIKPTKKVKNSKFDTIKNKDCIRHWLCISCKNYLIGSINSLRYTQNINGKDIIDFDLSDTPNYEVVKQGQDTESLLLIQALEVINRLLNAKERYIIFTHLLAEKHKQNGASYISKKIADILGIKEGDVRTTKSRALKRVRAKLGVSKLQI